MAGARRLMADFLLELLSEEIPARMQAKARNDLARLFAECTSEAGLSTGAIDTYSTPRRLVLIARDVADATEASREELKGPRIVGAAAGARRLPAQDRAFAQDQLEERDGVYFAVIERAGRPGRGNPRRNDQADRRRFPMAQVDALGRRAAALGSAAARHRRAPRRGDRARSRSRASRAARRRSDIASTIRGRSPSAAPADYIEKLRACHVIVDQDERERIIREGAAEGGEES